MFFSYIKQVSCSFQKEQYPLDSQIIDQIFIVQQRIFKKESLGFFEHDKLKMEEKVLNILIEQGEEVSPERLTLILEHLNSTRKNKEIRQRFWIQCLISLIILTFSIWYLQSANTDHKFDETMIGMMGTVFGYWLR